MNTVHTSTLISTLLTDDELPNDYTKHPEKYFVSLGNENAKKYTKTHLEDKDTEYIPGVILLHSEEKQILGFEHVTADIISTWVELLALTKSCIEGAKRLTFIMDSPYELMLDEKKDSFVLTVNDRSHVKGIAKSYSLDRNSYLQGILHGAVDAHQFFNSIMNNDDLEELKENINYFSK